MAEETEVIIKIAVDQEEAASRIVEVKQALTNLSEEKAKQTKAYKEGLITEKEYAEELVRLEGNQKKLGAEYRKLTEVQDTNANSINALRQNNKELLKERNNIDMSTQAGRDRMKELNKQLDDNNDAIKANVSNLEKQKLNIGNYQSALEGVKGSLTNVIPGLGGMTNGLSGITAGAKAFTATPFGATLQIIAGLLSLLIDAFKGSEEGQRNLNKITQVTTALFGAFGELIRDIGGRLIEAFKNPKQALIDLSDFVKDNLVNRFKAFGVILDGIVNLNFKQVANGVLQFGSGVENVIGKIENVGKAVTDVANKALEQGNKVAKLQADIEDLEDEANLRRARNDIKIAKLREDAIKQEGEAKKKSIEQAIALEKQSADDSIKIAEKKVELAKAELETSTQKKEATDKLEDAEVSLAQAQAERYRATLRFEKQLEGLNDAEIKRKEKEREDEEKLRERIIQQDLKREEERIKKEKEKAELQKSIDKGIADFRKQVVNEALEQEDARKKKSAEYEMNIERFKQEALANAGNLFFAKKQGLRIAANALFRQDALKEIYITTRAAAIKAYDSMLKIPVIGSVLGIAAAGAVTAYGLSQAAGVLGIPFARGGRVLSGQRIKSTHGTPIYRSNGDNLLATVRTGEVILNERQQAMLGGDRTFKRIGVPGFASGGMVGNTPSLQLDKVLMAVSKQKTVLVLEDFERVSNRKYDAEQTAIVI